MKHVYNIAEKVGGGESVFEKDGGTEREGRTWGGGGILCFDPFSD